MSYYVNSLVLLYRLPKSYDRVVSEHYRNSGGLCEI